MAEKDQRVMQLFEPGLEEARGNLLRTLQTPQSNVLRVLQEPQRQATRVLHEHKDYLRTKARIVRIFERAYKQAGKRLLEGVDVAEVCLERADTEIDENNFFFEQTAECIIADLTPVKKGS